jgi:hypothetical protein
MSAETYNQKQLDSGALTIEMVTELGRYWQQGHGLAVDGYIGPNTQSSIAAALAPPPPPPPIWLPWDGPLAVQPKNRTEVYSMFGNPGTSAPNALWVAQNIVELHGASRLPGVPEVFYVKLHKDVEPYAREGLYRALSSSPYRIDRFGGYVFRHQQYNNDLPLSFHSWGIACDVDSDRNYSRTFELGQKPTPWSAAWMAIWPKGVDELFVNAMKSCGWSWGGDWKTYVDPMHFEWVGSHPV